MFNKKIVVAASLLACSTAAFALPTSLDFDVSAQIPTNEFHVIADGGWNNTKVLLAWDPTSKVLNPQSRVLDMKNTAVGKGIEAYLVSAPELIGTDVANNIGLDITVNTEKLGVGSANKKVVMNDTESTAGKRVNLVVGPSAGAIFTPGNYDGTVSMMFDSEA
jgi:hypothetical protein